MSREWADIILDSKSPGTTWRELFSLLLSLAKESPSPVALEDATVIPDRLLSEAAWELWEAYPNEAPRSSMALKEWTNKAGSKAVLILDALSLRELPLLLKGAEARGLETANVTVMGSECPSSTEQFARALGAPARSALKFDGKPGTFALFAGDCYTDVLDVPFEDCTVPPVSKLVIWHSWLDDLIHLHKRSPEQIANVAAATLGGEGFWNLVKKLRQGRRLVITADHGYAASKRFSSEVEDPDAIEILRTAFGASRSRPTTESWPKRFMPPIVMTHNGQQVVMGQRKWKVQGGFPAACHEGMSLLEVAVPYVEMSAL